MPTLQNRQVVYQGGEALPQMGSPQYLQAQQGILPTPQASSVFSPVPTDVLGNITPVTVPPITPTIPSTPTVPPPTGTTPDATGNALINPPEKETEAKSNYQKMLDSFSGLGEQIAGKAKATEKLQEETKLAQKTQAATVAYNTYVQKKLNFDQKLVEMKNGEANTVGAYGGGYSSSIRDFEMRGNADLANLALQAQVAQGLEDAARQTIKDKLEMQFQPIQDQIDFLKDFSVLNQNDLTKKEAFQLQEMSDQKKSEKDSVQKAAETIHGALLKSGAPASVYSAVDKVVSEFAAGKITASEAQSQMFAATGTYGVDTLDRQLKQAQIGKINAEIAETRAGTSVNVTRTDANGNPLPQTGEDRALQIILGSGKFTKDQVRLVTNAINSGQDPFTVIKNQAKTILGGAGETTLTKYEIAESTLADIGDQIQQFYALGGRTGIFTGNFEKVVNKLGQVVDPRLVTLSTQIQGNIQVYRNAISGTAYSEQEGRDITSIFPGINKSQELNSAILKGRQTLFQSVIDATYRTALGSAYDELKNANVEVTGTTGTSEDFRTKYGY